MRTVPVTHETLPAAIERVRAGASVLVVPSAWKVIRIDARCLERWDKVGRECVRPATPRGFEIARGRSWDFVFPENLLEVMSL